MSYFRNMMLGIEEKLSQEIRTHFIKKHTHFCLAERALGWDRVTKLYF